MDFFLAEPCRKAKRDTPVIPPFQYSNKSGVLIKITLPKS
jgi:hypothetical protein